MLLLFASDYINNAIYISGNIHEITFVSYHGFFFINILVLLMRGS